MRVELGIAFGQHEKVDKGLDVLNIEAELARFASQQCE